MAMDGEIEVCFVFVGSRRRDGGGEWVRRWSVVAPAMVADGNGGRRLLSSSYSFDSEIGEL